MRLTLAWLIGTGALSGSLSAQGTLELTGDSLGSVETVGEIPLVRRPVFRYCRSRGLAIGYITGRAEVTFQLLTTGRPDTASLRVVHSDSISPEAAQSAARRYLSTCRFDAAQADTGPVTLQVRQRIRLSSRQHQAIFQRPGEPVPDHPLAADTTVWDVFGPSVEELPRALACQMPTRRDGRLLLSFIVGVTGKVEPASVEVLEAATPGLSKAAPRIATGCVYAPARVRGEPVRVRLSQAYLFR